MLHCWTAAPWGCEHTACEGWVAIIALILRIPSTPLLLLLLRIKNGDEDALPPPSITHGRPYGQNTLIFVTTCPSPSPPLNTTLQWVLLSYSHRRFCALSPSATYSSAIQWSHEGHATALIVRRGGSCARERERESKRRTTYNMLLLWAGHALLRPSAFMLYNFSTYIHTHTIFLYSYAMHRNVNGDWCMNGSIFALCIQVVLRILCVT